MDPKQFVVMLTQMRKNMRLSQYDFAHYIKVPKKSWQNWEQGIRLPNRQSMELVNMKLRRKK